MASLEARLKAELSAQVQEVDGLRTRMETQDQEHLKQTQQLNQKVPDPPDPQVLVQNQEVSLKVLKDLSVNEQNLQGQSKSRV